MLGPLIGAGPGEVVVHDSVTVNVYQLVRAALRLRPDRIIVGEVSGDEVLALVQAMNTGHDGSISTCHSNGPIDTLLRLESLTLQAAPSWPLAAIRQQVQRSIDVVIHVHRRHDGRRSISSIDEIVPASPDDLLAAPTTRSLATLGQRGLDQVGALTRRRARP